MGKFLRFNIDTQFSIYRNNSIKIDLLIIRPRIVITSFNKFKLELVFTFEQGENLNGKPLI